MEFGDSRDKKKIMEMRPWSYEMQLILLQDFDWELVPKNITMKWSPFWVQIYNLPLKSMTREAAQVIGSQKLEKLWKLMCQRKGYSGANIFGCKFKWIHQRN